MLFFGFSWMFLPVIPVLVPYALSLGFTMTEFLQLQAIFGLVTAVSEVPSGYFADIYGRKKAMFWGVLISALGFSYLYFARSFGDFIIHNILVATGVSLTSGADISLLYDSKNYDSQEDSGSGLISKFYFSRLSAEAVSAVLGGIVAAISYSYLLILTAITAWLPMAVLVFLQEPPVQKAQVVSHQGNFRRVAELVFFESRILRLIFFNFVLWSLSTFCAVWIIQKYWQEAGLDLLWFGVIWAVFQLVAGFAGMWVVRLEKLFKLRQLLLLSALVTLAGYLFLGFLPAALGIFVGFLFYISRGFNQVLYGEAMNRRISSEFRATINSMQALGMRLCFMVLGPIIGILIDSYGLTTALVALAGLYLAIVLLLLLPLLKMLSSKPATS